MNKVTAQMIRTHCKKHDVSYKQIYVTLGINSNWFNRMIMDNPKYAFINPNPERMKAIWDYLADFRRFQEQWTGG